MIKHNMVFLLHPCPSNNEVTFQGGGTHSVESNSQNQQSWGFGTIPAKRGCFRVAKLLELQWTLLQPKVQTLYAVLRASIAAQRAASLSA